MRYLAALLLLAAGPALAQVQPRPGTGDPRIQSIAYDADQVVLLQAAPGYQLNVEFAADEQIETVAVGDSAAWQVTPNRRGDHLFVKPVQSGVSTNMTVVTTGRVYLFELAPLYGPSPDMAFTVRFSYPQPAEAAETQSASAGGRYRLSGERALRPSRISDDGRHTYIEWPADTALPAVYALDDRGRETLVNGAMRDDLYVLDSIASKLVFRIDSHVARARRVAQREKN